MAETERTRLSAPAVPPRTTVKPPTSLQRVGLSWSLESIRYARDAQLRGDFCQPVRLAEAFRTNDALFTAYCTRVSTQSAIELRWRPVDSDAGRTAAVRAEAAIDLPVNVRESILGTLANHGLAIGYLEREAYDDPEHGPTVRLCLTEWPLEHVRYNATTRTLETRTADNGTVTITHGDGRWIVFRKFGIAPWTQDACVLPGALLWAAHAGGIQDWAGASYSHGQPKVIGTPREGVPLEKDDGSGELSPEGAALLGTLRDLASGESVAGVLPPGSTATLLFNGSTAWQVFKELILNREKAAMRIYLGTDAVLGSQGGAPGVDIAALFSVASTRIQGDFEALERGYCEGALLPWAELHGIAATDMPACAYAMPDTDGARRSEQEAAALDRLGAAVKIMKDAGLDVTQDTINALVSVLGVSVPCTLASVETKVVPLTLAPTDLAKVVRVQEARASQGLPAFGDERDDLTITELDERAKAAAAPPPAPGAPAGTQPDGDEPTDEPAEPDAPEAPPAEG